MAMTNTPENLKMLEECGKSMMTIKEAAMILQVEYEQLKGAVKNKKTPESQAYHRGMLLTKMNIQKSILKMAERGSNPAQIQALKMMQDLEIGNKE
jgi:hypothetical protein